MGIQDNVDVDIFNIKLVNGDLILMCTDGLTSQLENEDIVDIIKEESDLDQIIKNLIDEANDIEGIDNVTITLYLFEGENYDR